MPTPKSQDSDAQATPPQKASQPFNLLARTTGFFALLYVLACLSGFGVALAVEGKLAVPAEALFSSSFDLVVLSKYLAFAFVANFGEAMPRLGRLVLANGTLFWPIALLFAVWAKYPRWTARMVRWRRIGRVAQWVQRN